MGDHGIADERATIDDSVGALDGRITVSVPAIPDSLPIIRSVVEHALFAADWVFDDVVDVKLAVDEVCSQLMAGASDRAPRLDVALCVHEADFVCDFEATVDPRFDVDTTGFGWRVLETLTDARSVSVSDDNASVASDDNASASSDGAARQLLVGGRHARPDGRAGRSMRVRIAKRGTVE